VSAYPDSADVVAGLKQDDSPSHLREQLEWLAWHQGCLLGCLVALAGPAGDSPGRLRRRLWGWVAPTLEAAPAWQGAAAGRELETLGAAFVVEQVLAAWPLIRPATVQAGFARAEVGYPCIWTHPQCTDQLLAATLQVHGRPDPRLPPGADPCAACDVLWATAAQRGGFRRRLTRPPADSRATGVCRVTLWSGASGRGLGRDPGRDLGRWLTVTAEPDGPVGLAARRTAARRTQALLLAALCLALEETGVVGPRARTAALIRLFKRHGLTLSAVFGRRYLKDEGSAAVLFKLVHTWQLFDLRPVAARRDRSVAAFPCWARTSDNTGPYGEPIWANPARAFQALAPRAACDVCRAVWTAECRARGLKVRLRRGGGPAGTCRVDVWMPSSSNAGG